MGLLVSAIVFAVLDALRYVTIGSDLALDLAVLVAVGVMWYGMIVLISSFVPGRGNTVVWAAWAYALFVPGLTAIPLPPLGHAITLALNYINPLTYLGAFGSETPHHASMLPGGEPVHAAIAFGIGVVALAAGTRLWATREVTA